MFVVALHILNKKKNLHLLFCFNLVSLSFAAFFPSFSIFLLLLVLILYKLLVEILDLDLEILYRSQRKFKYSVAHIRNTASFVRRCMHTLLMLLWRGCGMRHYCMDAIHLVSVKYRSGAASKVLPVKPRSRGPTACCICDLIIFTLLP